MGINLPLVFSMVSASKQEEHNIEDEVAERNIEKEDCSEYCSENFQEEYLSKRGNVTILNGKTYNG